MILAEQDAGAQQDAGAKGPLAGIRVTDCTHMLAGPYCTWLLGALGADVIKIERRESGDFTREVAPFTADNESLFFMSANRNKRSITLDLKAPRGKAIFHKLISTSDVLVENNRAGVMERLGFGYAALSALNPRLVYASISGFGQTGPYQHRPCFDLVAQAMSGMMSITGEPGRAPCRVGTSLGDVAAGTFGVIGVLSALQQRERTGRGTYVDVAMVDCQIALMENAFARYLNAGHEPVALGSRHPLVAPFQAFPTADRPIAVCVDTEAQWRRLCTALEAEFLLEDARFVSGSSRADNHPALEALLLPIFAQKPRDTWLAALEAADVPASPINSIAEAARDPQVQHRGMIGEMADGTRFVRAPIQMPLTPLPAEKAPPRLGEHTTDILAELGLSDGEIDELRRESVV
jgi:crotonobetainyl-CoA:carnitine CoA-transferase CaiB-like acyl-CoA transferase